MEAVEADRMTLHKNRETRKGAHDPREYQNSIGQDPHERLSQSGTQSPYLSLDQCVHEFHESCNRRLHFMATRCGMETMSKFASNPWELQVNNSRLDKGL